MFTESVIQKQYLFLSPSAHTIFIETNAKKITIAVIVIRSWKCSPRFDYFFFRVLKVWRVLLCVFVFSLQKLLRSYWKIVAC
jgi:hypothetical protein